VKKARAAGITPIAQGRRPTLSRRLVIGEALLRKLGTD